MDENEVNKGFRWGIEEIQPKATSRIILAIVVGMFAKVSRLLCKIQSGLGIKAKAENNCPTIILHQARQRTICPSEFSQISTQYEPKNWSINTHERCRFEFVKLARSIAGGMTTMQLTFSELASSPCRRGGLNHVDYIILAAAHLRVAIGGPTRNHNPPEEGQPKSLNLNPLNLIIASNISIASDISTEQRQIPDSIKDTKSRLFRPP